MKRILLSCLVITISFSLFGQLLKAPAALRNYAVKKPIHVIDDKVSTQNENVLLQNHSKAVYSEEIGQTIYDLQSNSSVDNRIYKYDDGTIGTTYTVGTGTYADRGTGYNYFDGSAWTAPIPTTRIETIKTGWPSYSHLGLNNEGEVIVCHQFTVALIMLKRAVKGTGIWSQTTLPKVTGTAPAWPRMCTSGNTIHILSMESDTGHVYQGQKNSLFYSRSTDGGTTWAINDSILPGLGATDYATGFSGDVYSWAEPQGNTIAFVVGDNWTDLILMKSLDGGSTWTKTKIFQHPYPNWNDNILTPDTPYVCDGAHAVSFDAAGNAHVVFGVMRVLNDVAGDNQTSYFPGVDGIGYWKEGDPTITSMNPDDLYATGKLIGWMQDTDGDGQIMETYAAGTDIPSYYLSCSSMPQISIDGNNIYVVYKSIVESMQSSSSQFFSHIWGTKSTDGGATWCDQVEITTGADFDLTECVFPTLSKTIANNILNITFQMDFEPGFSVRGDLDPAGSNSIMYLTLDASSDLTCFTKVEEVNLSGIVNVFPNPVQDNLNISFSLNKASEVNMTIVNLVGSTVTNETFVTERGELKQINVSKLPAGIYMAKFETEKGTFTKKFIKQ